MTPRIPLPNRRPSFTATVEHRGHPIHVTVGFDLDGQPKEVFATGPRAGSEMAYTLADACILISIELQRGARPEDLAKSMGTMPAWVNGEEGQVPASPIGAILGVVLAGEWRGRRLARPFSAETAGLRSLAGRTI